MNKTSNFGLLAVAIAVVAVGAVWLGIPLSTLVFLGVVLACPLMMMFMMGGMHGGGGHSGGTDADHVDADHTGKSGEARHDHGAHGSAG